MPKWIVAMCLLCCGAEAWALSIKRPSWPVLIQKSTHIVKARVTAIKTTQKGRQLPFTWTHFQVQKVYKGSPGKVVKLRLVGASTGRYRLLIPGVPRFRVGEEVLLCVRRYAHAPSPVLVALGYGVFDLKPSRKGKLVSNRGGLAVPSSWSAFEAKLKRTIAAQRKGVRPSPRRPVPATKPTNPGRATSQPVLSKQS